MKRLLLASLLLIGSWHLAAAQQFNTSNTAVVATGSSTARTLADRAADIARPEDFGALGNGSADDESAIQAALDTGKDVVLECKTYAVSAGVVMHSGQKLLGECPSSALYALPGYGYEPLVSNANFAASALTDHDITISSVTLIGTNSSNLGAFHAIGMRYVNRAWIDHVTCVNTGDCTAFQASQNTSVTSSISYGATNVAFDHWEGPVNAYVGNSTVYMLASTVTVNGVAISVPQPNFGTGIMFTASGGNTSGANTAGHDYTAEGNRIFGASGGGIVTNTIDAGSALTGGRIINNFVDVENMGGTGINVAGKQSYVEVAGNTVQNSNGGVCLFVAGNGTTGNGNHITLKNDRLVNCNTSSGNIAPIVALGTNNLVKDITLTGGVNPDIIRIDDVSTIVDGVVYDTAPTSGVVLSKSGNSFTAQARYKDLASGTWYSTLPLTAPSFSGAVTPGGSGANQATLSDYRTAVAFTPGLSFGGGSTGLTCTCSGTYTRIGNLVYVQIKVQLTAKGSSTGAAVITGLPFGSSALTSGRLHVVYQAGLASVTSEVFAREEGSTVALYLGGPPSLGTAMTDANFNSSAFLYISGWYALS